MSSSLSRRRRGSAGVTQIASIGEGIDSAEGLDESSAQLGLSHDISHHSLPQLGLELDKSRVSEMRIDLDDTFQDGVAIETPEGSETEPSPTPLFSELEDEDLDSMPSIVISERHAADSVESASSFADRSAPQSSGHSVASGSTTLPLPLEYDLTDPSCHLPLDCFPEIALSTLTECPSDDCHHFSEVSVCSTPEVLGISTVAVFRATNALLRHLAQANGGDAVYGIKYHSSAIQSPLTEVVTKTVDGVDIEQQIVHCSDGDSSMNTGIATHRMFASGTIVRKSESDSKSAKKSKRHISARQKRERTLKSRSMSTLPFASTLPSRRRSSIGSAAGLRPRTLPMVSSKASSMQFDIDDDDIDSIVAGVLMDLSSVGEDSDESSDESSSAIHISDIRRGKRKRKERILGLGSLGTDTCVTATHSVCRSTSCRALAAHSHSHSEATVTVADSVMSTDSIATVVSDGRTHSRGLQMHASGSRRTKTKQRRRRRQRRGSDMVPAVTYAIDAGIGEESLRRDVESALALSRAMSSPPLRRTGKLEARGYDLLLSAASGSGFSIELPLSGRSAEDGIDEERTPANKSPSGEITLTEKRHYEEARIETHNVESFCAVTPKPRVDDRRVSVVYSVPKHLLFGSEQTKTDSETSLELSQTDEDTITAVAFVPVETVIDEEVVEAEDKQFIIAVTDTDESTTNMEKHAKDDAKVAECSVAISQSQSSGLLTDEMKSAETDDEEVKFNSQPVTEEDDSTSAVFVGATDFGDAASHLELETRRKEKEKEILVEMVESSTDDDEGDADSMEARLGTQSGAAMDWDSASSTVPRIRNAYMDESLLKTIQDTMDADTATFKMGQLLQRTSVREQFDVSADELDFVASPSPPPVSMSDFQLTRVSDPPPHSGAPIIF